ncbi:hypothetical protein BGX31_005061 [Mortierella sp. GBA43]|nr:hypothetical protein BGX31_005061 [Mortierella sp. GBA43]
MSLPTPVNPATLFKGPIRAIWNVKDGENVPTIWWPAKGVPPSDKDFWGQTQHTILIMIPGNPGMVDYYIPFLQSVYDTCQQKIDIFGGHSAGSHVVDPSRMFSLEEQVENKIAILDRLREIYPAGTRFILAGHSMGSWLALRVLKARPNDIERVFALFPTIDKIADTPNGRKLKHLFRPTVRAIVGGSVSVLRALFPDPEGLQSIVKMATGQGGDMAKVTSQELLHSSVVKNCLFLAGEEMVQIKIKDKELIEEHASKFVFYYGKTDEWSPIENYYEMQAEFPSIKIHLCEQGMAHAFVLQHGAEMGVLVGGWINDQ